MAQTVRRRTCTHNVPISHCAISGKTGHRRGAVEIGGAQREGHGPGTTRASPEEKPRDSPAPGLHSRTHSLDPSTGGNDITGFCPKNSEARNVIPAVGITYIRASPSLSRIFEFCRITDQRGRVWCRGQTGTARRRPSVCATPTKPVILKPSVSTKTWRANGNSWRSELKNNNGKGRLSHLATSKSACAAVCRRRGDSLASQHLRQIGADRHRA